MAKTYVKDFNGKKYECYTVVVGDCLSLIAEKTLGKASLWTDIQKLNGITGTTIRAGQVLKIREIVDEGSEIKKAFNDCIKAIEKLPEFQKLESLL